ncbi:MAG: HAMP domain-containing protein [Solirubrobacterales bacterium]|nr:HAMP domain-containing protein [Solirubrobacterales bacterium]
MNPISITRHALLELWRPGESELRGRSLVWLSRVVIFVVLVAVNLVGLGVVLLVAGLVVPEPHVFTSGHVRLVNLLYTAGYTACAFPLGSFLGFRAVRPLHGWSPGESAPTEAQARAVLLAPARLFGVQLLLWLLAAPLFGVVDFTYSPHLGLRIGTIIVFTGVVTASCAYLAAERLLRSLAAHALSDGAPSLLIVPGVTTRTLLAWMLGTAVPMLGLAVVGILALADDATLTVQNLGATIVTLCGIGTVVGFIAVLLAARTIAEPIGSVRRALAGVERGEFDGRVPVYDGSQIGQLQLGFNQMAAGLAERERIRQAFGTYVDPDVVARVIDEGTDLAGEQVDVTCMFIDVRSFTQFAEQHEPPEVVAAINRMFDRVVPIIQAYGGRVDKFVGDGLLAVFGAPRRLANHADSALSAGRDIAALWAAVDTSELSIGIGLNSGPVVAGNVGGGGRFEFSVIGDPVNVASRVEAATRQTGDVLLISEQTRDRLSSVPAGLVERHGVTLKGKTDVVRVYGFDA